MKFSKILFCSLLFAFISSIVYAQVKHDHLAPLKTNPVLVQYTKEAKKNHSVNWRIISDSLVAKLPFKDDFSHGGPYPNDSLWMDNAAFINLNYPICPISMGVATLDGLNNEGQPINPNCPPGASYPADSLTSRPFDFSIYKGTDSIYLSFYYQAGGRGYAPLTADSLLLQFRTSQIPWTTVWYHLGYTPVFPDTGFHLVMFPLNDTLLNVTDPTAKRFNPFVKDFQFRFRNYACTSANVDQWNIDQVYMNKNRTYFDTAHFDISFVYESPSLLKNYEYMPWEQFTYNDLADSIRIYERNNDRVLLPLTNYTYTINTATPSTYSGGAHNIQPFYDSGYNDYDRQIYPLIKSKFSYTPLTGPDTFTITHVLQVANDFDPWNDTLRFKQTFSDYYAYDDGTAEAAYFINGTTPIYLAYQFTLNNPDTIRGLELYFNYVFVNPHNYAMRLAMWDNSGPGGSPGNLKHEEDSIVYPTVADSLNGFTYYPFHFVHPDTIVGGTFYVGWVQTYGDSLNIGWDYNTNHSDKVYYNVNVFPGGWLPASYPGSMMMRPVFGGRNAHGPVINEASAEKAPYESLSIYPNPASNSVTLSITMPANTILKMFTEDGRECLNNSHFSGNSINTSSLPAGFYIVEVTPDNGKTYYQKLLIQR